MSPTLYLVAGIGKTGHSIARYLQRRNKPFVVFDTRLAPEGLTEFQDEFPGVDVFLGEIPETLYPTLAAVITSPGVSLDEPVMRKAIDLGISVFGDIECLVREIQAPIVAITGTNGKSTVTTLVGDMAKAAGINVAIAGNIGQPVLDLLDRELSPFELWVLELSSFQLELTESLAAAASTILNVTPDHLDRHHTLKAYVQAKQRIYRDALFVLYNREDKSTSPERDIANRQARVSSFGLDKPKALQWGIQSTETGCYLAYEETLVMSVDEILIKGKHNWTNALAACALAHAIGISFDAMRTVLKKFAGLPHRTQWVRTLDGVEWINDSKGTNIGATMSAILGIGPTLQGKIVLIAGGQGKGADFHDLRPAMNYIRSMILIGEDACQLADALGDLVEIARAPSLEQAVMLANRAAKPQDVVLLSPACASLDMFRDYNHRGEVFVKAVNSL